MMGKFTRFQGLPAVFVVGIGQLISLVGTNMTTFALILWVWQENGGRATEVVFLAACHLVGLYLLTPLAGALVDRWDRKFTMILADVGLGTASVGILLLHRFGHLEIHHLYGFSFVSGAFEAFQVTAFSAAVTMMVDKKHYARASGVRFLANSSSLVLGPAIASVLFKHIGLDGILVIDLTTFVLAVLSFAFIHVPAPPVSEEGRGERGLAAELVFGWHYIRKRRSLLSMVAIFFGYNFALMLGSATLSPLILARTGDSEIILGTVQSLVGVGGVGGGILMSIWGGPRRRIQGVVLGMLLASTSAGLMMGMSQTVWIWGLAAFFGAAGLPVIAGSVDAIWQCKVPPDIQGRVFATRRFMAQISAIPAFLLVGPLADGYFEPAMLDGGAWAETFGFLVGTGRGAGFGLVFVISGILGILAALTVYLVREVWQIEDILDDHPQASKSSVEEQKDRGGAEIQAEVLEPH